MKNIILPNANSSIVYLSDITPTTNGIIIVYSGEKAIGHITSDPDYYWNFSVDISSESDITEERLPELANKIIEKYKDVSFKLLEFK